jgi:hypothetical protein
MSYCESYSLVFAYVSMDRYACQFHENFSNNFEDEIIDDCIDNYMFLADNDQYASNHVSLSFYENHYEERVVVMDNQDLIMRELESHQFSRRKIVMDEQVFSIDQYVSNFCFKDPVTVFMESYVSYHLKISNYSPTLPGEFCFLDEFLSLLLYFRHLLVLKMFLQDFELPSSNQG